MTDTSHAALIKALAPSIVAIKGRRTQASGFVWKEGAIVTAEEPLHGEGPFHVTFANGKTEEVQLRGRDPSTDIAVLTIAHEAPPAKLQSITPMVGNSAMALGSTDGESIAAFGHVARAGDAWRSLRGGEIDQRIELDLRLRRGLQGALAIDAEGRAFGMVVAGPMRRALVIPAATIERIAPKLMEHGRIARGYLGLSLQNVRVTGDEAMGSMIMSLDPEGPGAKAGLHQGDVLVSWNGVAAQKAEPLSRALAPESVGRTVDFGVRRSGTLQTVRVTIGERPAA
jgi:S1-C subfamily serine protease